MVTTGLSFSLIRTVEITKSSRSPPAVHTRAATGWRRSPTADIYAANRFDHPHHRIAGIAHQQHLRLTLVANVVVALQPDADMQHQETNLVFADGIGRVFPQLVTAARSYVPRHRVVLFDVIQQRIGDHDLVAHAGDHGLNVGQQIGMQLGVVQQVVVILAVDVAQDVFTSASSSSALMVSGSTS
jgi:hypothetical protein